MKKVNVIKEILEKHDKIFEVMMSTLRNHAESINNLTEAVSKLVKDVSETQAMITSLIPPKRIAITCDDCGGGGRITNPDKTAKSPLICPKCNGRGGHWEVKK